MAKPGSGLLLDPQQTALTMNQRIMFNRLVAQGTPAAVARQVAIAVAKRALVKAEWSEADHPRDDAGRFGEGAGGGGGGGKPITQASALNDFAADSGEYVHINQAAQQFSTGKVRLEDAPDGLDDENYGEELREKVMAIDSAIDDYPLERDTKLARGMVVDKNIQVGKVLDPHGFTSMSKSTRVAKEFADAAFAGKNQDKAIIRVNGKFGQPILDTTKIIPDAKGKLAEKEYLLARGYGLKIVADHGIKNGRRVLDAEVVRHMKKSEGQKPPVDVQSACRRGLELAPEYGGQGLTDGAKARARSMAAGNFVTPDQLRRMHSFFSRHDSYGKQSSPPSPGFVSWQLWGGDAGKRWAASQVEKLEKAERRQSLARACVQARVQARKADIERPGYHKAFAEAAKAILPVSVTEALHRRARAVAGGHGKAAALAYAETQDMGLPVAKAEFNEADHPRADDGKFGSGGGSAAPDHKAEADKHFAEADKAAQKGDYRAHLASMKAGVRALEAHHAQKQAEEKQKPQPAKEVEKEKPAAAKENLPKQPKAEAAKPPKERPQSSRGSKASEDKASEDKASEDKASEQHKPEESADKTPDKTHGEKAIDHAKERLEHVAEAERAFKAGDKEGFERAMAASQKSKAAARQSMRDSKESVKAQIKELTERLAVVQEKARSSSAQVAAAKRRLARLDDVSVAKGNKPLGAAFSHARATGEKQDEKSRKRRANEYLREKGHEGVSLEKTAPDVADVRQEEWVDAKPKRKRKGDEEREPAAKSDRVPVTMPTRIVKAEDVGWKKLVWSVVYEPDVEDTHGDYMDAETIEKAAHGAMRNGIYINREHAGDPVGAHVVESYVAPCEMRIGPPGEEVIVTKGSWVMGMQIETEELWADVLDGTFTGFSLEGSAAVPAAA